MDADLRGRNGKLFEYEHVGGEDSLVLLKHWGVDHAFGRVP